MAGVMHVTCGPMKIKPGTRIGQYLSFDAEALSKYDGSYGIGKEHDKKYEVAPDAFDAILEPVVNQVIEIEEPVKRGRGRPRKVSE
jgi:hypothetical protein